jgi:hypothetical protein
MGNFPELDVTIQASVATVAGHRFAISFDLSADTIDDGSTPSGTGTPSGREAKPNDRLVEAESGKGKRPPKHTNKRSVTDDANVLAFCIIICGGSDASEWSCVGLLFRTYFWVDAYTCCLHGIGQQKLPWAPF